MLPISGRTSKEAKQGTPSEHLAPRTRKLVRDADVNIFCSASIVRSVENLDPLDSDRTTKVEGNPWCGVIVGMANRPNSISSMVDVSYHTLVKIACQLCKTYQCISHRQYSFQLRIGVHHHHMWMIGLQKQETAQLQRNWYL